MAKEDCHRRVQEHRRQRRLSPSAPIGVFDSGVGGLSVLRSLRARLPNEHFVYFADSAHAPYGERGDAYVIARSLAVAAQLIEQHGIKALVVACNTATAAAIDTLRHTWPALPIVGVEPALKPAAALTRTGHVAVMATRGTLTSRRFAALHDSLKGQARFALQPCDGLAEAIERQTTAEPTPDLIALCIDYTGGSGQFGTENGQFDTLVLGCTHYPFVADTLQGLVGPRVRLVETGAPVAAQLERRLLAAGLLKPATHASQAAVGNPITLCSSGSTTALMAAAQRWLDIQPA